MSYDWQLGRNRRSRQLSRIEMRGLDVGRTMELHGRGGPPRPSLRQLWKSLHYRAGPKALLGWFVRILERLRNELSSLLVGLWSLKCRSRRESSPRDRGCACARNTSRCDAAFPDHAFAARG